VVVHFTKEVRNIFFSPEINEFLHPDYYTMRRKVRKQMHDT